MNLRQIFVNFITSVLILFSTPAYAYAQTQTAPVAPLDSMKYTQSDPMLGSKSAGMKQNPTGAAKKADTLQTRAEAEIQRRVTSLTELITTINGMKHVSAAQKTALTAKIQAEITSLNALLAKIQANTDPATLKTDVQSIVTSYRIYAVFMPQVRLLAGADSLLEVSENMSSFSGKLQTRITAAQAAGQDTTSLQALLTDMNTKIADAQTQANAVIADVTPLTPEGYPANKTVLQQAKTKLQTGIQDIKTAGLNARQIIQGLVIMNPTEENASSNSAVPKVMPGTRPLKAVPSQTPIRKAMPSVIPTVTQ